MGINEIEWIGGIKAHPLFLSFSPSFLSLTPYSHITMTFLQYSQTIDKARNIYLLIHGHPSSHEEWAESFNIIGAINELLQ